MASKPQTPAGARRSRRPAPSTEAARSDRGRARAADAERRRKRKPRSDLTARILWAIPAIALALFLVIEGGPIFTLGMFILGGFCLHEFYGMYERARPARLAGFAALAALLLAALYGDQYQVLLVAVVALPVTFGLTMAQPRPSVGGLAVTVLGMYWIGFALAHAVLLRGLPHGGAIVIDVLVGTFLGDTGAYLGGGLSASQIGPDDLAQQDGRGARDRHALRHSRRVDRRALRGMAAGHPRARDRPCRRHPRPPGDLFESFIKREAATRTRAACSGPTAGRSTGSTRCCSRPWRVITSGRRTCIRGVVGTLGFRFCHQLPLAVPPRITELFLVDSRPQSGRRVVPHDHPVGV